MLRSGFYNSARVGVRSLHGSPATYSIVDGAKEVLQKANKKTGEVLASGMETAEKNAPKITEDEHKKKVRENAKGYKDLQDKGSKAETEQNRAEDGM